MLKNCLENNLQISNRTILKRKVNYWKNKDKKSKNI
jgi:hypothetical protein